MKYFLAFYYTILLCLTINAQTDSIEFSPLSGNKTIVSEFIKHGDDYFLLNSYLDPEFIMKIYRISEQAEVLDSMNIRDSENIFFANIHSINDKLYLGGIKSEPNSQRYIVAEFNSDFSITQKYESPLFDTLISPLRNGSLTDGTYNRFFDFTVFNDTCYIIGDYLLFDTLSNLSIGRQVRYFKATLDGNILINKPFNALTFNMFFRNDQLYFQGSNPGDNPFLPKAVGQYDGNSNFVNGTNFDTNGSGEWPWGACGGTIDDKLYFSYLGRDQSLSGCPDNNVAIDIRDTAFNILHRFKIEECEYKFAGNMPFSKGVDGSIYFQTPHQDFKKFLVKKYTPDMSLIWSREYDFSFKDFFTIPMKLVPTEDGGVIAHCREELNGVSFVRLYKITPDGEVVSSTTFNNNGKVEPSLLSPNPCIDKLHYMGESNAPLEAMIYSVDGKIRKRRSFDGNTLELRDLPSGLYSVLIFDVNDPKIVLHRQTVVKVE